jgi:GDP-L-fucose synthase
MRHLKAMNKDAKIYVAGHRGLVGAAIVKKLKNEGYSNLVYRTSEEVDLRNQSSVETFFTSEKPEYVFLAAAKVGGIYANDSYPADFIRDNLQIQTNVIDSSYRHGVLKLLFLGSSCIYPKLAAQPLREEYLLTGTLEPTNEWYAVAKIAGIKMCQAYRKQYSFNAISIMPTNLYGGEDNFDLENSHVLPALIRKFHLAKLVVQKDINGLIKDEKKYGRIPDDILDMLELRRVENSIVLTGNAPKVMLWGSGSSRREFLHVDDLAAAALFLMENYDSSDIINVGTGEDVMIQELAEAVQKTVGFEGEVIWDRTKPDGTPQKLMDVRKINDLGWQSTIKLTEGLSVVYKDFVLLSSEY